MSVYRIVQKFAGQNFDKLIVGFIGEALTELEIAVGHWPFSDQFSLLAKEIKLTRPNLLYIPMRKPSIDYTNVATFKEWVVNFKLLVQALH